MHETLHQTWLLTRVLYKNNYSVSLKSKKGVKTLIYALLLGLCFIPCLFLFYTTWKQLLDTGLTRYTCEIALLSSNMVAFLVCLLAVPSLFYFSKDTNVLLPLPVKPTAIVLAKTTLLWLTGFLTALMFLLPLFIALITSVPLNWVSWLALALQVITGTIPGMLLAAALVIVLMRFVPFFHNKDRFTRIVGLLSLAIAVPLGMFVSRLGTIDTTSYFAAMMTNTQGSLGFESPLLYPINSGAIALSGDTLSDLLLYAAFLILALLAYTWLARALWLPAVLNAAGASSAKKEKITAKSYQSQGIRKALFINENRILLRTPAFFTNCLVGAFITPVILPLALYFSLRSELGMLQESLAPMIEAIGAPALMLLLGLLCGFFISPVNSLAATSFSRLGQNISFMKYIPVSLEVQVQNKWANACFWSFLSCAIMAPLFHLLADYAPWLDLFFLFGVLCAVLPTNYIGLLIDALKPKLIWDDETAALKNNMNVMLEMLLSWLLLIPVGLLIWGGFSFLPGPLLVWALAACLLCLLLAFLLWFFTFGLIKRSLNRLS